MKKQYIQPSMKAYNVKAAAILAGSSETLTLGSPTGSNSNGGPTAAEGKGFFDDWDD